MEKGEEFEDTWEIESTRFSADWMSWVEGIEESIF